MNAHDPAPGPGEGPPLPGSATPPSGSAPPPYGTGASGFWDWLLRMGLRRDTTASWLGGVCSGIARRVGVDPLLIRALAIILGLTGVGVMLYLIAWLLIPDVSGRILLRDAGRGSAAGIALVVAAVIVGGGGLGFGFSAWDAPWHGGWIIPVLIVVVLWLVFARRGDGRPHPAAPHGGPGSQVPPPAPYTAGPRTTQPYAAQPYAAGPPRSGDAPEGASGSAGAGTASPLGYTTPGHTTPGYPTPWPGGATFAGPSGSGGPQDPRMAYAPAAAGPALHPAPPRRRPAPRGSGVIALGLAVAAFGVGYLLDGPTGFPGSPALLGLLAALATASAVALGLGLRGRAGGLASALTVLLLLVAIPTTAAESFYWTRMRQAPVTWIPHRDGAVWNGSVADLTVDLSSPGLRATSPSTDTTGDPASAPDGIPQATEGEEPVEIAAAPRVEVHLGAGKVTVLVPRDLAVTLDAQVGVGQIRPGPLAAVGQTHPEGVGVRGTFSRGGSEGEPLKVSVQVGAGDITIKEK